jgi:hypothetical protein
MAWVEAPNACGTCTGSRPRARSVYVYAHAYACSIGPLTWHSPSTHRVLPEYSQGAPRDCFGTASVLCVVLTACSRLRMRVQPITFSALPTPTRAQRAPPRSPTSRRVKPRRWPSESRTAALFRSPSARAAASSTPAIPAKSTSTPTRPAPLSPTRSRCAYSVRRVCVCAACLLRAHGTYSKPTR